MDDGKVQLRAEHQPPGVHAPQWKNQKSASLLRLRPKPDRRDPMPRPPKAFTDRSHVEKLVKAVGRSHADPTAPPVSSGKPAAPSQTGKSRHKRRSKRKPPRYPEILVRSCVVTHTQAQPFGAMLAAEAHQRRFFDAQHRVFLGDGSPGNWTLQDLYFPGWIPLLDFIHLIEHLYQAAKAASPKSHWPFYLRLLNAAWNGNPRLLLRTLKAKARNAGPPPPGAHPNDPRGVLARAVNYIEANRQRMDYPRARRLGLPITTSYVESLINEFNSRVKTCRQFWCPSNVEGVLQVRAACLSTTQRWQTFWDRRGLRHAGRIRPPARPAA